MKTLTFSFHRSFTVGGLFAILFAVGLNSSRAQGIWIQKADFGGTARGAAVGFSIGSKGYIGTGDNEKDFWEYDLATDVWTQKADFGGIARAYATGFSIGTKGYVGTGANINNIYLNDFWEYDSDTNTWTQKANFGGGASASAVGFSIGSKGYIGTGLDITYNIKKDFWEYDPATNTWTQKADFEGPARAYGTGFSIGTKGYIGTGSDAPGFQGNPKNDFWEYDATTNAWTQKANFGGTVRQFATGFSIGNKGYIGTGTDQIILYKDFWEYDPSTNVWTQRADFGGTARQLAVGLSIGGKGYIGTGSEDNDCWEYTPDTSSCTVPTNLSSTNITSSSSKLKWDAINDIIFYKVSFKKTGTSEWKTIKTLNNNKTLHELAPNTEYTWKVKSLCSLQPNVASDWSEKLFFTTAPFRLTNESGEPSIAVYPNPLISSATILFDLTEASSVTMELMDVNGRIVAVIANQDFPAGNHEINFDRGALAAGIYFLQMKTGEGVMMKKLILE